MSDLFSLIKIYIWIFSSEISFGTYELCIILIVIKSKFKILNQRLESWKYALTVKSRNSQSFTNFF